MPRAVLLPLLLGACASLSYYGDAPGGADSGILAAPDDAPDTPSDDVTTVPAPTTSGSDDSTGGPPAGDDTDADADGYDATASGGTDCDDGDPEVHPGAAEVCGNGVDDDCVGGDTPCDLAIDFEGGTLPSPLSLGGDQPWFANDDQAHGGTWSAESGAIADSEDSRLTLTVDFPSGGALEFWHQGSTEEGYDVLTFYVDGAIEWEQSGSWSWTVSRTDVGAGTHTFDWRYAKDGSLDDGQDTVWIDDIVAEGGAP